MIVELSALGTPEIILISITLLFLIGIIIGAIFLIRFVFKKKDNARSSFPVNHYTLNMNSSKEFGAIKNTNLTDERLVKEKKGNTVIALPQQSEIRYVEISQIIRCEADDNYTKFITNDENILVSRSLKEYADQLQPNGFLRTHQSHLVNPLYVKSWLKEDGGMLLMKNGDKVSVSKPNREYVKSVLGN